MIKISNSKTPNSRWLFRFFLYATVCFYVLMFLLSNNIKIDIASSDLLMSIIIGNFACTITAVSIFAVFDYRNIGQDGKAVLLTAKSKIWFIDAILLALCNLMFSLILGYAKSQA